MRCSIRHGATSDKIFNDFDLLNVCCMHPLIIFKRKFVNEVCFLQSVCRIIITFEEVMRICSRGWDLTPAIFRSSIFLLVSFIFRY